MGQHLSEASGSQIKSGAVFLPGQASPSCSVFVALPPLRGGESLQKIRDSNYRLQLPACCEMSETAAVIRGYPTLC